MCGQVLKTTRHFSDSWDKHSNVADDKDPTLISVICVHLRATDPTRHATSFFFFILIASASSSIAASSEDGSYTVTSSVTISVTYCWCYLLSSTPP